MRKTSINRWITRCFLGILLLSMIISAAANLLEAYNNTIRWGSQMALVCAGNVTNLLNHQWGLDVLDQSAGNSLYLACDEWIANVVHYSGAAWFGFNCEVEGNNIKMTFSDDGIPFDPTEKQDDMTDFDYLDQGGMGLHFIRGIASEMAYDRAEDRNVLTLRFPLDAPNRSCQ